MSHTYHSGIFVFPLSLLLGLASLKSGFEEPCWIQSISDFLLALLS